MDLETFVSATLTQIITGIKNAQKKPGGGHIAAGAYISSHGSLLNGGTSGYFTIVDFDVSVAAEHVAGGTSVRVADVESTDNSNASASNLSRVKFCVHVRIPAGGPNADTQDEKYLERFDDD